MKRDTPNKLDPRSIKCIVVGYPKETMGYYFYYLLENKIFVAQNAEFFENSLMVQEASGSHGLLESSGSDKGLKLIQEEDTQPSENTSEIHNEVAPIEGYTPIIEKPGYRKSQGAKTPSEIQRMQRVPYASAIGSIMYAVRCTRPDVTIASNLCSRFKKNPASMEAVWMRKFIDGLGGVVPSNKRPMEMLCDNEPAIAIANDPGILKGTRH
nr:hypothetical protein [Tanacetum cinerariifolium]